jgi:catechol 2,3-dioxygenase-like lactoylglutathione lyase family enzyme
MSSTHVGDTPERRAWEIVGRSDAHETGRRAFVESWHAVAVFLVSDAERSLRFYTEELGFSLDWNHREDGRTFAFQVSLFGFQLILNQVEPWTEGRAGHGRVFLGLKEGEQSEAMRRRIEERKIETTVHWGEPSLSEGDKAFDLSVPGQA